MSAGRIVVGVDRSDSSAEALRWAKAQADATGAKLVVVTAWSYPSASHPSYAGYGTGYVPRRVPLDIDGECRRDLEALVKETIGDDEVELHVVPGHPANVILGFARDASMVVVGSRGHNELVGALLGSVSQRVAAHAPCPVVVIRRAKAA